MGRWSNRAGDAGPDTEVSGLFCGCGMVGLKGAQIRCFGTLRAVAGQ